MVTFRCKQSGNTVSFTDLTDIASMRRETHYEEVVAVVAAPVVAAPVVAAPVVAAPVMPAPPKAAPRAGLRR